MDQDKVVNAVGKQALYTTTGAALGAAAGHAWKPSPYGGASPPLAMQVGTAMGAAAVGGAGVSGSVAAGVGVVTAKVVAAAAVATAAAPLVIGAAVIGGAVWGLYSLFSDES